MNSISSFRFAALFAGAAATATLSVGRAPAPAATAYPAALYRAIEKDSDYTPMCGKIAHIDPEVYVRKISEITTRQLTSGKTVYVAYVHDGCICGDGNCLTAAFVQSPPGAYREVFSTSGFGIVFGTDGSAVIRGHDSAAVSTRDTYQFDGTEYRLASSVRVFNDTGETKPAAPTPVNFATGTSSTTVRGTVRAGFDDLYSLNAAEGQTMSVELTRVRGDLSKNGLRIFNESQTSGSQELTPDAGTLTWRGKLPASGSYQIWVEGAGDSPASYAMTIEIR